MFTVPQGSNDANRVGEDLTALKCLKAASLALPGAALVKAYQACAYSASLSNSWMLVIGTLERLNISRGLPASRVAKTVGYHSVP